MQQQFTIPSTGRRVDIAASFVKYENATPNLASSVPQGVQVRCEFGDLGTLLPGDAIYLPQTAAWWQLTPADPLNNAGVFRLGVGSVQTTRVVNTGSLILSAYPEITTPVSAQATVTNASAQLVAASSTRNYLAIQNNDSAGVIALGGAGVTFAAGLKLGPGGVWEPPYRVTGAVHAIGSLASNANIVVMTG